MRRLRILLVSGLLALGAAAAGPRPVALPLDQGRQALAGHLELLEGPPAATVEEAAAAGARGAFRPLGGPVVRGYRIREVWLRFALGVPPEGVPETWLEVKPAFLGQVTLYSPRPDGGFDRVEAGAELPFRDRALAYRNVLFPLGGSHRPLPGPTATFYLRVRTRTTMTVDPVLWEPQAFCRSALRESLCFGAFFGIGLLVLATHALYWFRTRDRLTLLYAAYSGSMLAMFAGVDGFAAQFLSPGSAWAPRLAMQLGLCLQPGLGMAVFSRLVDLPRFLPRLDRAYRMLGLGVTGAALAATLTGHYFDLAGPLYGLLLLVIASNCGMILAQLVARWPQWNRGAGLYALAFGPYMVGVTFRVVQNLALAPTGLLGEYGLHLGAFAHFCLMNLPLHYHLARHRRERDQAMAEALDASARNERELESRVRARTLELQEEHARTADALEREQLIVAQQKQFLSMVSHEFRTPLAVIDGSAQLVEIQAESGPGDIPAQTRTIRRKVRHLLRLLDTWLTRDRIASGLWEPRFEPVAPEPLLREFLGQAREIAPGREILLRLAPCPGQLHCDRELLGTALQNLLDNALKYSPADRPVELAARPQGDGWLLVEVLDHGQGIPGDQLDRVASRFFRGRNAGNTGGLGLGLHLVRTIAALHQGRLELESVEGRGTAARLLLPLGAPPRPPGVLP